MNDRYKATGAETRFQVGSNEEVLENRLGIASKIVMDQKEYDELIVCRSITQTAY